jgi:predicted MFS family arabinose efflux permease
MSFLKTILASVFLGGCVGVFFGILAGLIVPLVLWPQSNVGPAFGIVFYGLPIGVCAGTLLGFIVGLVIIFRSKRRSHNAGASHEHTVP